MKYLKRLAVLALPVVVAVSLGVPASAAPKAGDTRSASHSGSSAAAKLESYIYNGTGLSVGVAYLFDNQYLNGTYDLLLPSGTRTDTRLGWMKAEAVYIGPGYCASTAFWDDEWWPGTRIVGPRTWYLEQNIPGQEIARWEIRSVYRC
ncbi:hypothetical protein E1292_02890 [Nonomuraea deserti]|uniref:Uncharacterized protein n=1 Tax=Nonomuraea deserti TaxID=1848322 RepID=A0A4R4W0X3_9ACTN|nr:hypothetical protein [Nonomuraea deserti]TDD12082.1 hypothetical protein E1292_02890 [Nonomuraea deserti]